MKLTIETVPIVVTNSAQAQNCDAVVIEQDTYQLLGVGTILDEPETGIKSLAQEIEDQEPLTPGEVLVTDTKPVKLTAIVYDIEQEPICSASWVKLALEKILYVTADRSLNTLRLPMLGCTYGNITPLTFIKLLRDTLRANPQDQLKRIILIGVEESLTSSVNEFHLGNVFNSKDLH